MRKYAEKGLEILHGFLLLSMLYCVFAIWLKNPAGASFVKSLIFLPVIAVFSVTTEKIRHFWQFFLLAVGTEAIAILLAGSLWEKVIMGVCVAVAIVSYFAARAKESPCWLEVPAYPWLLVYIVVSILGKQLDSEFLVRYACFSAGSYFLIYNFYTNLVEMDAFVQLHSSLNRLPVKRLGRVNQGMMWLFSGIIAAAMFAAPFLKIDELIRQLGLLCKNIFLWLVSLISSGPSEQDVTYNPPMEAPGEMLAGLAQDEKDMTFLLKLLNILAVVLAAAAIIFLVWLLAKKLYNMYLHFNDHTEENGDKIEHLDVEQYETTEKRQRKEKKENLFWDLSANARIRKHYMKKVRKGLGEPPKKYWTPKQMEEQIEVAEEDRKNFHEYYEKARYAEKECSREEMQQMLKIR